MPDEGPEEWYRNLKPITRGYMTACFATTVLVQMELLPLQLLYLDISLVVGKLELWRLLTNFCFFGTFSLPFVFSMFFLIRYGRELESKRFEGRSADMLWFMVLSGIIMMAVTWLGGGMLGPVPFLSNSMLSSIVYLWSREYSEQVISIFGLFNVQAFYFPWVRAGASKHSKRSLLARSTHRRMRSSRSWPCARLVAHASRCSRVSSHVCIPCARLGAGALRHPQAHGRLARARPGRHLRRPRVLLSGGRPGLSAACASIPRRRPRRAAYRSSAASAAESQCLWGPRVGRRPAARWLRPR